MELLLKRMPKLVRDRFVGLTAPGCVCLFYVVPQSVSACLGAVRQSCEEQSCTGRAESQCVQLNQMIGIVLTLLDNLLLFSPLADCYFKLVVRRVGRSVRFYSGFFSVLWTIFFFLVLCGLHLRAASLIPELDDDSSQWGLLSLAEQCHP